MEPDFYICDVCGKTFTRSSNLKRHMQGVHNMNGNQEPKPDQDIEREKLTCVLCNRQYVWKKDLQRHINAVHLSFSDDSKLNKCSLCSYSTRYKSDLKKHSRQHIIGDIGNETHQCTYCEQSFKKHSNLKRHVQETHTKNINGDPMPDQDFEKEKPTCVFCNSQYVWKKDLQRHLNTFHLSLSVNSELMNKCPVCSFSTKFESDLKKHMNKHNVGKKTFETQKCTCCEKTFKRHINLIRHVQEVHNKNLDEDSIPDMYLNQETFTCDLCKRQYLRKQELRRHIRTIHASFSDDLKPKNKCSMCSYSTRYNNDMKKHINVHMKRKLNRTHRVKCSYCSRTCIHEHALKNHIKKYHQTVQSKPVLRRKCCLCSKTLNGYRLGAIRSHLEEAHNIPMEWENHSFNSMTDFEAWKRFVEKETTSAYVFYYGSKSIKVYKCHRSGMYTKSSYNKRETKIKGSCKINSICPSVMKVNIKENKVLVSYLPSHVGHKNELKHIRLTTEERKLIAVQLAEQIPHETILKSIHGTVTDSELQRIHLINKKDMFNIEQSLSLSKEAIKNPLEVVVGLEAWVKELEISRDKAFIAYKPQGEVLDNFPHLTNDDFVLIFMTEAQKAMLQKWGQDTICIDRTFDLNSQNLQLYTLLTLDEIGEGFPAAFMLTNKGDESSLITFLENIKSVMGPILCNVFMSDMEETFYSAWEAVMGPANSQIFNTWHILKAWATNLNKKITVKKKRDSTNNILQAILCELDENTFLKELEYLLTKLGKDTDTLSFRNYFEKNYVVNEQYMRWPYCYRINAGINTTMSLDNFNAALRHCNLRGKGAKKLDKNICSILTFFKDNLFDVIIKMKTDKLVQKLEFLRKNHIASLSLDPNTISQPEDDRWHVPSSQNSEFHIVKRVQDCNSCFLRCNHCNSCLHEFVCSCLDNAIDNHMCEHIHLVKRTLSDRKDKSNIAEGSSVVSNMEEDKTDLQNLILYTINAPETAKQQYSISNERSPPITVNHHLDLDSRKKFLLEKIQENIMPNLTTLQKFDHFENILDQASTKADT